MNTSSLVILSLILSIIAIGLTLYSIYLGKKAKIWEKIFSSENQPDNLEEVIRSISLKIKTLSQNQKLADSSIDQIGNILKTAVQYVAVERFDSNADDGGNLSFSLALLDGDQTGTIITSLHGRQQNRIYCKQVVLGQPQQTLSNEEQNALINALAFNKQKLKTEA